MDRVLFAHSSADGHSGFSCSLAITNTAAVNIHAQIFLWTCCLLSWLYTQEWNEWQLGLTFWGASKLFSKVAVRFYIPTSHVWGFEFLQVLSSICYCLSVCLTTATLCSPVVLTGTSLMSNDPEHLFVGFLVPRTSSLEKSVEQTSSLNRRSNRPCQHLGFGLLAENTFLSS